MAEALIQWGSPQAARLATASSLRRRGDIRAVGPNGHTWGRMEDLRRYVAERSAGYVAPTDPGPRLDRFGNPRGWNPDPEPDWTEGFPDNYRIIQVGGISAPNLRKMLRRWTRAATEGEPEFDASDPADRFVEEHRYAWRLNIRELPAPKRIELRDTGFTTITKAQFIAAAVHKALSVEFDDTDPDGHGAPRALGQVDD